MIEFNSYPRSQIAVKVSSRVETLIKKGHPWVFEDSIVKQNKAGKAGDRCVLFDQRRNKVFAIGLYDPDSPIRIKIIANKGPQQIDVEFFESRISAALSIRKPLLATQTNSYRLIHGENDGLPGFVADVYAHVLVVKLYSAIWYPYLETLIDILIRVSQCQTVVLRLSRKLQKNDNLGLSDGQVIYGELQNDVVQFWEHGVRFSADVLRGHKTGYFLDHRHNRQKVGKKSLGKTVLDVFAYAGGFTVHALAGGATKVTSLDISTQALKMAQENARLNSFKGLHKVVADDAFKALNRKIGERKTFDLVVIDPPSFAKSKREIEQAKRKYSQLASLGIQLTNKGGTLVLASCSTRVDAESFLATHADAALLSNKKIERVKTTFHDIDHPIGFQEGAYLKCAYYKVS